jgi:hypothetical protein
MFDITLINNIWYQSFRWLDQSTIAFIIYSTYAVGLEFEFVNDKMLMYFQKLLDGSPGPNDSA